MNPRSLGLAALAGVVLSLQGCVNSGHAAADLDYFGKVDDAHGIVSIAVTTTTRGMGDFPHMQQLSIQSSTDRQKTFTLVKSNCGGMSTGGTCVFIGALPAGLYTIESGQATQQAGNYITTRTWPIKSQLGAFRVTGRTWTDLGMLLFTPDPALSNRFYWTWAPTDPALRATVKARYEKDFAAANMSVNNGWVNPVDDMEKRNAVMRRFPGLESGAAREVDGWVLLPGRAGSIVARNPQGEWSVTLRPSVLALKSVDRAADGRFLTHAEYNALQTAPALAGPWTDIALPTGLITLNAAGFAPDGAIWAIGTTAKESQDSNKAFVWFRGNDGAWQAGIPLPKAGDEPVHRFSDRAFIALSKRVLVVDLTQRSVVEQPLPYTVDYFYSADLWAALPDLGGFDREQQITRDGGKTWREVGRGPNQDLPFVRNGLPVPLADGRVVTHGDQPERVMVPSKSQPKKKDEGAPPKMVAKTEARPGFYVTADHGATWTRLEGFALPCGGRNVYDARAVAAGDIIASGKSFIAVCDNGTVHTMKDDLTWDSAWNFAKAYAK
jgi:hypothetical protein